ncbi:class I SAM-dependent methyltransferase [Paractinoplanes atraurantiacus]|uniref:class I SAM-dependent methyltransferase n=1 Tax=Paractinoplanes atraurantiacus TaxID=1036182 RepID=UPI0015CF55F4|nr:class I SAM-dependent methyltransferase [Actinoplanes atraurantiacus]
MFDAVEAYRAAFGYRDIAAEVDVLCDWFARHHGGSPGAVLEVAAGPADHALEFARRGASVTALDLSPAMCAVAGDRAREAGLRVDVVQGDMTAFRLGRRFDLVLLLLDSASLLLTEEAMAALLHRAAEHLAPGGLLVADLAVRGDGPRPDWTVGDVRTRWGSPQDAYDPVTGVEQVRVRISVGAELVVDEIVPARAWSSDDLVRLGPLELVGRYSSMAGGAGRDVPVLRRRP